MKLLNNKRLVFFALLGAMVLGGAALALFQLRGGKYDFSAAGGVPTISAVPASGTFGVGQEFDVDIVVNGDGTAFTSFGASVSTTNLTVVSLTKGGSVTNWTTDPTTADLDFYGGVAGQVTNITAYTVRVKGNSIGQAAITITNAIVRTTDGYTVTEITATPVNGTYAIGLTVDAGPDKVANGTFTQTGSAPNATSFQWSKTAGAGTITFGTPTASSTTITANAEGDYIIRLTAYDGAGNSAYDEMQLTWDTIAPNVNAGADKITKAQFTQNATVTGAATFQWTKTSGSGTITFGTPNAEDTTISASADGSYTLRLTATDLAGNSAFDEMALTWDTTAPTVNAGADKVTKASFTQTGTASGATSYQWSKTAGTGTITFSSATALSTTVSASADGSYTLRLTATDAAGNSASDQMNLTWDTTAPTVNAGTDKEGYVSTAISLAGTASEAGSYQWAKSSGTGTVTFSSTSNLNSSVTISAAGSFVLTLTATDAAGNSASDTITIGVHKNGDINNDTKIDNGDFTLLMFNWGTPSNYLADLNNSSLVDNDDFTILMYWWAP